MMRKILFRGKKIDNDEWTYGFYFEHSIDGKKDSYIKYQTFDEGFVTNEVVADTVGQFTGLFDKEYVCHHITSIFLSTFPQTP